MIQYDIFRKLFSMSERSERSERISRRGFLIRTAAAGGALALAVSVGAACTVDDEAAFERTIARYLYVIRAEKSAPTLLPLPGPFVLLPLEPPTTIETFYYTNNRPEINDIHGSRHITLNDALEYDTRLRKITGALRPLQHEELIGDPTSFSIIDRFPD